MIVGIVMLVATGMMWSVSGAIISQAVRRKIHPISLLAPASVISLAVALAVLPDYGALLSSAQPRLNRLILIMILSGCFNSAGMMLMLMAMRHGHHGTVWTMVQSTMVCPFLMGILLFGEPVIARRVAGVSLILFSLVNFGLVHGRNKPAVPESSWFMFALLSFLFMGIQQSLMTIPSYWKGCTDPGNIRVPLFYVGLSFGYIVLLFRKKLWPNRRTLPFSIAIGLVAVASFITFFRGLDLLADSNMVSLGFPLTVGTCIAGFAAYSLLILHEKANLLYLSGIILGVAGIVMIAS